MKAQIAKKYVTPKWVDRLVYGLVALMLLSLTMIYVPELFGLKFRRTGLGSDSWSMTSPTGGVRPLSIFYIAKQAGYGVGDIVSFTYDARKHHPGTETKYDPDGQTIKMVARSEGSKVLVYGLYLPSTTPPCWVDTGDIEGKICAGPVSLMPSAICRWMTMNYQLSPAEMNTRQAMLTEAFLHNPLTWGFRLGTANEYHPRQIQWSPTGRAVALTDNETRMILVKDSLGKVIYVGKGLCDGWKANILTFSCDIDEGRKWNLNSVNGRLSQVAIERLVPFDALGDGLSDVAILGDVRQIISGKSLLCHGESRRVGRCRLEQFDPHGAVTIATMLTPFHTPVRMGDNVKVQ